MSDDKQLQIRKENIFTKLFNFIKDVIKGPSFIDTQYEDATITEDPINDFNSKIRSYNTGKSKTEAQINFEKYEKGELDLSKLSNKEVHELNREYQKIVLYFEKVLSDKLKKLEELKAQIQNTSNN